MITIYGIKNCSTMKKAFDWFDARGIAYTFHDYKKTAPDRALLQRWCEAAGWEALVNRKGTTWRKLAPAAQAIAGNDEAIALMLAQPSVIRRPVVCDGQGPLLIGFDDTTYAARFDAAA